MSVAIKGARFSLLARSHHIITGYYEALEGLQ